jgi:hypothetical protein
MRHPNRQFEGPVDASNVPAETRSRTRMHMARAVHRADARSNNRIPAIPREQNEDRSFGAPGIECSPMLSAAQPPSE